MAKKKAGEKALSFEEMMAKLDEIATELESGELPLEKAIERYEEGVGCYKECHRILAGAEKKVELLTKSADGALEAEPFEGDDDEASADETDDAADDDDVDDKPEKGSQGGTLPF